MLAFSSARVDNDADIYMVFLDKELEGMQRFELDQYFKDAGEAAKKKAADRAPKKGDGKKDEAKKDEAKKDEAKKDEPKDAKKDVRKVNKKACKKVGNNASKKNFSMVW